MRTRILLFCSKAFSDNEQSTVHSASKEPERAQKHVTRISSDSAEVSREAILLKIVAPVPTSNDRG
jgi:hypothetical protein